MRRIYKSCIKNISKYEEGYMSAFTKIGRASTSAIKSVGKELATNALVQTLSGKKGRINYGVPTRYAQTYSMSRSPSLSPISRPQTPINYPMPLSRKQSLNSIPNLNSYDDLNYTLFKPITSSDENNKLQGGKKKTKKNRKRNLKKTIRKQRK